MQRNSKVNPGSDGPKQARPGLSKTWAAATLVVLLAGCADPVGVPKPLPVNIQEESQATATFHKYGPHFQETDGVLNTYLTAHNNPRQMVVVVKDKKTAQALKKQYGRNLDGLKVSYEIVDREGDDAPIEAVPKAMPDTWWGKVVSFFQTLPVPWATRRSL